MNENASGEARRSIETKLQTKLHTHHTFQPDLLLRNAYYHDDRHLFAEIQRATQKLLPNDNLRQVYSKLNKHGYDNCIQQGHYQQQQHQQHQQHQHHSSLPHPSSITPTSSIAGRSSNVPTAFSIRSSSSNNTSRVTRAPGSLRHDPKSRRVQKAQQKQRRLDIQRREMEKRKAIEKQIRASQLARFALRKTTRKKIWTLKQESSTHNNGSKKQVRPSPTVDWRWK